MFDIGWAELFVIAVVALIVVGPKDLPKVLRSAARVMQKARGMSREFQNGLAEIAREAEFDDIKRKMQGAARFDLGDELRKSVDPTGKLSADFDPAEFNRQIKAAVEGGPPARPAAPLPPDEPAPPSVQTEPTPKSEALPSTPAETSPVVTPGPPCGPGEIQGDGRSS
ncbi:MAG TPA: Sec-independent protein translocase protein TatB [Rhodospirillales bacterium]|nr:Sec-independent protein translocase protein TatB [Rhodospirillales bacterium]